MKHQIVHALQKYVLNPPVTKNQPRKSPGLAGHAIALSAILDSASADAACGF
jgi:hypothetical protein